MRTSVEAVKGVVSWLSRQGNMSEVDVVQAYETTVKPSPVDRPIAAVSAAGVEVSERLQEVKDNGQIVVTDRRKSEITIKITVYVPYAMGSQKCYDLFDRIYTHLLYNNIFNAKTASCGGIKYVRDTEALVMDTSFVLVYTSAINI